jgi:deoxyribonuclease V
MLLMEIRTLHRWDLSIPEAMDTQRRLASQVVCSGDPGEVRTVAGVDISVLEKGSRPDGRPSGRAPARGAVVVLSYPGLELLEQVVVEAQVTFPYVPGLLSFRETPVLLEPLSRVRKPDLLLVDGQGLAHPRRFGIACHLGLLLDVPTIGCAKSRLCGEHGEPDRAAGSQSELRDGGQVIGAVLRTRDGVNPLYISVGHRIGLSEAVEWVLRCCRGLRLPEPTRLAHQAAGGQVGARPSQVGALGRAPLPLDSQRRGDGYLCRN